MHFDDNQFYPYPPIVGQDLATVWDKDAEYAVPVVSPMGNGPKGDKGDKMTYGDLSEHDVEDLRQGIMFSANKSIDDTITTTATIDTIEIPIADYDEFDMLFVDINGLDLAEGEDYTISGHSIILETPIPAGQDVHFRVLRYLIPDGNKTIVNAVGRKDYNTVAQMKADDSLKPGDICHTLGFHKCGDGGGAWYKIITHAVANEMDVIQVGEYFAVLQIIENFVTPEMFGAYGDGVHDDSGAIEKIFISGCEILAFGEYLVSRDIMISNIDGFKIDGNIKINGFLRIMKSKNLDFRHISVVNKGHASTVALYIVECSNVSLSKSIFDDTDSVCFSKCENVEVSECSFLNHDQDGYPPLRFIGDCKFINVLNNTFKDSKHGGVMFSGGIAENCRVSGNYFLNISADASATDNSAHMTCINFHGGHHVVIDNNVFKNFHVGCDINGTNSNDPTKPRSKYIKIINNSFEESTSSSVLLFNASDIEVCCNEFNNVNFTTGNIISIDPHGENVTVENILVSSNNFLNIPGALQSSRAWIGVGRDPGENKGSLKKCVIVNNSGVLTNTFIQSAGVDGNATYEDNVIGENNITVKQGVRLYTYYENPSRMIFQERPLVEKTFYIPGDGNGHLVTIAHEPIPSRVYIEDIVFNVASGSNSIRVYIGAGQGTPFDETYTNVGNDVKKSIKYSTIYGYLTIQSSTNCWATVRYTNYNWQA